MKNRTGVAYDRSGERSACKFLIAFPTQQSFFNDDIPFFLYVTIVELRIIHHVA